MTGVSPLTLALEYRHWATARLILAIALAQYKPQDAKSYKFTVTRVNLGEFHPLLYAQELYLICKFCAESDDSNSTGSNEDDSTYGGEKDSSDFIDISQRPSEVQVDVSPEQLLSETHRYQDPKTKSHVDGCPLQGAIIQNDFATFVQITDLYKSLPSPLELPSDALAWAMKYDRPDMLDEVIRRTASGIDIPEEWQDEEETGEGVKLEAQSLNVYFGLNIHGKKRKDLARKVDPDAPTTSEKRGLPLAWIAAHDGALECVRYLASERASAAYRYYASTHSDKRARYLRSIDDQIVQRLGWCIDELNESVITAAVIGDNVELLRAVMDLRPTQLEDSLMAR